MTLSTLATPVAIVAVTLNVFASTRASEDVPQTGTHKLSKAEAMPPHGLLKPPIGSSFLFVFGSILSTLSFPCAKAEAEKNSQSGLAGAGISDSGFRFAKGI